MSQTTELSKISNEDTAALPPLTFAGDIVVVESLDCVERACCELERYPVIGFDTETRPSFKAGVSYKVSLIQLSTPERCFLFRINKTGLTPEIVSVLENPNIIKLGADVDGDIRSLNALQQINPQGFYDLQKKVWEWGVGEKSLRKMSALVLGHRISKAQRLSNWEAITLTKQQQLYAATDAWACIEIYQQLQSRDKLTPQQIEEIKAEAAQRAAIAAEKKAEKEREREQRRPKGSYRRRPRGHKTNREAVNSKKE